MFLAVMLEWIVQQGYQDHDDPGKTSIAPIPARFLLDFLKYELRLFDLSVYVPETLN